MAPPILVDMSTSTLILAIAAAAMSGLTAGVFIAVSVSTVPLLVALPAQDYVRAHRLVGKGFHPLMPIVVTIAVLSDIAVIALSAGVAQYLAVVATVLGIAVQIISHFGNMPINRMIAVPDLDVAAPTWNDPRSAWCRIHTQRLVGAIALFGVNLALLTQVSG